MKKDYQLRFITPCFCAGADLSRAEIRPASIRGELRRWLRIVGAKKEQEQNIMGGVTGTASKSLVTIRVSDVSLAETTGVLPKIGGIDPITYLLYFASVSGKAKGEKGRGPRIRDGAFIAPGSSFKLTVVTKDSLSGELAELFERALQAMLLLGSLGLRVTRTCGAWVCQDFSKLSFDEYMAKIKKLGLKIDMAAVTKNNNLIVSQDWQFCLYNLGTILKYGYRGGRQGGRKKLTAGKNGSNQTPLGSSSPRQKSGLNLRPIAVQDGMVPFIYYTDKFLGDSSKRVKFDLEDSLDQRNLRGLGIRRV